MDYIHSLYTAYIQYTSIYRSKTKKHRAEVKYRCSEAGDARKKLIYTPIYTNIQPVYTKTGLG
uniref:Uncharacterized protein n=1 Tax=Solanum tuberosum TaxID=4113 RepID=M1CGX6_SOLTU